MKELYRLYSVKFAYYEGKNLVLGIKGELAATEGIMLQLRAIDHDRFILRAFVSHLLVCPTQFFDDIYIFKINLEDVINNMYSDSKSQRIEFLIKDGENHTAVMTSSNIATMLADDNKISDYSSLRHVKREKGRFEVILITECVDVKINKLKRDDSKIIVNLNCSSSNNYKLFIKRRSYKNITKYTAEIELERVEDNCFSIDIEKILELLTDQQTNFDFTVRTIIGKVEVDQLLMLDIDFPKETVKYSNVLLDLYATNNKSLAISVRKNYLKMNVDIGQNEDNIMVCFLSEELEEIRVCRELPLPGGMVDLIEVNILSIKSKQFLIDVPKIIKSNNSNIEQNYIILGVDSEGNKYTLHNVIDKSFYCNSDIILDANKTTGIRIFNKPRNNKVVNLAVLGSCFSRIAFTSKFSYYNPDYKSYFKIDYTCFWFSVFSATSKKIQYNKEYFADAPEKIYENDESIRREYEKTLFDELKNSNAEYIIIDFFVDALHGVYKFGEDQYLARNTDINLTPYLKNHIILEKEAFTYKSPGYFEVWKKSIDLFIDRMEDIVPLSKVILNLGGLTTGYFNENQELKNFIEEKKFDSRIINNHNVIWNRMNNYFMAKCPEVNVIDMSKFRFYSDIGYPTGACGPHHYESNFYKAYLGEVAKIVMKNKNNNQ